ncbi:MAG: MgtC/SapB family protein [Clostridia bacterium]|nr:MgtC/SapB family protein [Clostridia bacterium]
MVFREITLYSVALRLLAAVVIAGILGMEREKKSRAAGLRTYILVCMGSCLIMLTNQYIYQTTGAGDPMRLGAQVVSGIGFLGAGTIIVTKRSQIKGLTTAAGLWSSAAVGLALGAGFYEAAVAAGVLIYFVMTVLQQWDKRVHRRSQYLDIYLEYSSKVGVATILKAFREMDFYIDSIDTYPSDFSENASALILSLKLPKRILHSTILADLQEVEGVIYIREL